MKIPETIQVAGKIIAIKRDDKFLNSEQLIGQCRNDEDVIYIPTNKNFYSKQCIEQTLIHEVIHKINNILNARDERNSEEYVNPLSELLYQVINQL